MTTRDLPSDEVPAEDWAEQQTEILSDSEPVLVAGEIDEPIIGSEANEADVVEQETGVSGLDEER